MGFDVFGMNPRINGEVPHMVQEAEDAPEGTSLWDMWGASQREEYSKQVKEYRSNNPGVYFYNSVWFWKPLWNYVYAVCSDIIDEDDLINGCLNDHHQISQSQSKRIAGRLYKVIANGQLDDAIDDAIDRVKADGEEGIPFNRENVENFALFCKESGGFEIC